jgi:hypothetical protein
MILRFGENPKGVNIFTEHGHFVQIQIADGILKGCIEQSCHRNGKRAPRRRSAHSQ